MLDHVSFSVENENYAHSLKFYDETLQLLGYERLMSFDFDAQRVAGYGVEGRPFFWLAITHKVS